MKKTYVKPYIAVETFQLDAAIASSCSSQGKTKLGFGQNSCTLEEELPGLGYFGLACEANVVTPNPGDEYDEICYHGPIYADMFMNS